MQIDPNYVPIQWLQANKRHQKYYANFISQTSFFKSTVLETRVASPVYLHTNRCSDVARVLSFLLQPEDKGICNIFDNSTRGFDSALSRQRLNKPPRHMFTCMHPETAREITSNLQPGCREGAPDRSRFPGLQGCSPAGSVGQRAGCSQTPPPSQAPPPAGPTRSSSLAPSGR